MTEPSSSRPEPAQVRAELGRILSSSFVQEGSLPAKMLSYVVERSLSGEERTIKAYTIAVEALGRSAQFDPDRDSTVRVAAMRLRSALDLYYSGPGASSALRIRMVPGSYRPIFEMDEAGIEHDAPAPGVLAGLRRAAGPFLSMRALLLAMAAMIAVNFALTLHLMAKQGTPPREDFGADKAAVVYELIQADIQRAYGQETN